MLARYVDALRASWTILRGGAVIYGVSIDLDDVLTPVHTDAADTPLYVGGGTTVGSSIVDAHRNRPRIAGRLRGQATTQQLFGEETVTPAPREERAPGPQGPPDPGSSGSTRSGRLRGQG